MNDDFMEFIARQLNIDENVNFEFREVCGFTFVFKQTFFAIREKISSAEIKPVGIIYEENGEYYFAPLDEINNIDAIIKEFCKNCLK